MENKPTIHPTPQLAIGLIVILLGVLFTLDNLNLLDSTVYFHYWPVLLLAYGVYRLIEPGNPPHLVPGVVFTVVGGVLFLNALHFHLSIRQYWPVLLIFFDIQMPKLNGFEVLELMGADTGVIFATAYDEYALRAFEVHAVDYLLKPFGAERFGAALEHARFLFPA
jgi:CheY-like chemotaxis protein